MLLRLNQCRKPSQCVTQFLNGKSKRLFAALIPKNRTGTGFFITGDGYLISIYHVVKGAAKVHLVTGAGSIDASVVKLDAANDLAGTVATVGFPDIGLQGFAPKVLAHGHHGRKSRRWRARRMTRAISRSLRTATMQPGNWPDGHRPLVDARGNVVGIVAAKLGCGGGAGGHRVAAGECELRGEKHPALELPGVGAGRGGKTQGAECEG